MAARLEADERQRRTLLADVSHELRTPLAVIQGNLEAILDGVYPADEAHLAADPRRDAGAGAAHRRPADAGPVRGRDARPPPRADRPRRARRRGRPLVRGGRRRGRRRRSTADIDGDLPILDVDPVRIREVLANLVANALRHTPAGGTVTVGGSHRRRAGPARGHATPAAGIEPALLPHVFDRFVKGDDSRGSGLGLAIARRLVEAHGGEITAESALGAGHVTIRRRGLPRYGRVIRTSSTAASTVLAPPRSAASNTIRTVSPAHGAIET